MKKRLLLAMLAGCGKFEDPAIVVDLRPIAMQADYPEQVVDVDLQNPPTADQVLAELHDAHVRVLLSDRNFDRSIRWHAELCNLNNAERCDHGNPYVDLGSGTWLDPDRYSPGVITIPADGNLLGVLFDELQYDALHGLGGISYGVSVKFGGVDADPALDQYAAKSLAVQPNIPAPRLPNTNPTIDHIDAEIGGKDAGTVQPLPLGVCGDGNPMITMPVATKLHLTPVELPTTRETYSVPTIDGKSRTFTEAVTYQWLASAGKFSDATTGGGHDPFGNLAPADTDYTSPAAKDVDGDIQLWTIVRDERLGVSIYMACVHIQP
ncbi:MAG: hypothetical protein JO257_05825 [Deltaproteobacteria bacterium]|nr:hypothetical protein [Deltaproteobacteria bacterium]